MKNLIIILVAICLFSCKKEDITPSPEKADPLPYTQIIGHTWRGLSDIDDLGVHYYQFMDFKSDTTVGIYTAAYDESVIFVPEIVYHCKIITKANHDDSVSIFYPDAATYVYHTTGDVTKITDDYTDYTRIK